MCGRTSCRHSSGMLVVAREEQGTQKRKTLIDGLRCTPQLGRFVEAFYFI